MKTKDRIIDITIKLFNQKGTTAVTTNHIAAASGISPGNLYYHFRNKEEIIRTIFLIMAEKKDLDASYGSGFFVKPHEANIEALFHNIMTFHWEYRFFFRELNTLLTRDAALKKIYAKYKLKWLNDLENSIHAFIDAGIFKSIDEPTVLFLKNNLWIIGTYWHSFLNAGGQRITMRRLEEGVEMMRKLLRPYLKSAGDI